MKKLLLSLLICSLFQSLETYAQAPFLVYDSIDINKYHFPFSVHGNMLAGYDKPHKGATDTSEWWIRRSNYFKKFQRTWISGYDASNNLKLLSTHTTPTSRIVKLFSGPAHSIHQARLIMQPLKSGLRYGR